MVLKEGIIEFMRFEDACDNRKLVLFGASIFGAGIMRNFFYGPGAAQNILYFCDNDEKKWGTVFCGKEVRPPSALAENKDDIVVLVTSEFYPEIRKQLKKLGIAHVFYGNVLRYKCYQSGLFSELFHSMILKGVALPDYTEEVAHKKARCQINENYEKIDAVKQLLSDEISKDIYQSVVDRKRYGFSDYEDICDYANNQYFDENVIKMGDNEVFIDIGCYDGATSIMFSNKSGGQFKKIYAFEPDISNFEIAKKVAEIDYMSERFELFNYGLSDKNGTVKFSSLDNASSKICDNGDMEIEVRTLDSILKDKATFIKIDAEGEEFAILKGAENTIKINKPKLAVCIYHKIEDLWEIPLYIKQLVPEYKMFIRHYHYIYTETVLYAVI